MSDYNAKNYTEQGGEKTVIGGTLEIKEGASVTGLPSPAVVIPAATADALGGVKAATKSGADTVEVKIGTDTKLYVPAYPTVPSIPVVANQTASTAADVAALLTDFNALLEKLKVAGLMSADVQG